MTTAASLTPLFKNLPEVTLGAIVIYAVWHNISLHKVNQYRDNTRLVYTTAIAAMVGFLAFGLLEDLVIAALIDLISFLTTQGDSNSWSRIK